MFNYLTTLSNCLENTVESLPDNLALLYNEAEYRYSDIYKYCKRLANFFLNSGLKKGDRILITLGNVPFSIISFWAALRVGCVPMIIHPGSSPEYFRYIIADAEPSLIICRAPLENEDSIFTLIIDDENLSALFSKYFLDTQIENKLFTILDVDLACIIYTSGSTGEPKGVMLTHRNMLSASASIISYLQYKDSDRILCVLPISFDYGLYQMIMAFSVGATLLLEKDFHFPMKVIKNSALLKASVFPLVPSMVSILYEHQRFHFNFSSVRCVTNTGAVLNTNHINMLKLIFPQAEILSMYGLTECKRCTYLPPARLKDKPNSVGIAIPNSELWIIDENGLPVPANTIGQIVIRGAAVMQAYWNKPEKTAEKLRAGFYANEKILYSGDYGWLDKEGYLYLHGRADEMLKSRGIKVSPFEIEA
jgi:acyl-CoA synthetase (AMP-forming)/AMP-acid ligase II